MKNLHNHTTWSDGSMTIMELALEAKSRGITELGVSDHFETDKTKCFLGRENIPQYIKEIREVEIETGLKIYAAAEVDLMNITQRMAILPYTFPDFELNKLDYVLFEYAGSKFAYSTSPNPWIKGDRGSSGNTWQLFLKFRKLIKKPVFLAHPRFDLSFTEPDEAIVKVLKTLNIGLDLNSGDRNTVKNIESPNNEKIFHYMMRMNIYKRAAEEGVSFITGSDTHAEKDEISDVIHAHNFAMKIKCKLYGQ